jgi:hypothetical protein
MPATRLPGSTRAWPARAGILATAFGLIALGAPSAFADPLPSNCSGTTTVTCTFGYNGVNGPEGSPQTWIVPAGVASAHFDVYGAQGGGTGGLGGHTAGTVSLTPGATVTILVGGVGTIDHGGYNGGGSVNEGGGGASDIRIGGTGLADRVLVAGGGGGSTVYCTDLDNCTVGGAGGGTSGGNGTTTPNDANPVGGGGGTQTAGGAAAGGAGAGSLGQGGNASTGGFSTGGSGGGGYYGGAGGGDATTDGDGYATAGGGGSGYYDPALVTGGSTVSGVVQGPGQVTLTYNRAAQTITFPPLRNRSLSESPFTLTGVSAPGGPVTFSATGACTVAGARVTLRRTGTCTITAHQAGDDAYQPAPTVSRSFTVTGGPTGTPALRIGDRSVQQAVAGTQTMLFPVTLSRAVSVPVRVHWRTVNGSAEATEDFVAASGTLTIPAGQTLRTVAVTVQGERRKEGPEYFTVVLSAPVNATIADGTARGTILNNH